MMQGTAQLSCQHIHRIGLKMKVYEHSDPNSLKLRSHPWIDAESDPTHRYYDFRTHPELIRSSLEDMKKWDAYPATETFYRLLEWLNGSDSIFETNDCAFSGAAAHSNMQTSKRLQCSGRLMILYRDLVVNTSEQMDWLTQAAAHALQRIDPAFEWGAIGATLISVRFMTLPGPTGLQWGQQLMLSFWTWGEHEGEMMTNLDRTFHNLTTALRGLSDEVRRSSLATAVDA
jgi:hypothetical protein